MTGFIRVKWFACLALALAAAACAGCSSGRGCRDGCPVNAPGRPGPAAPGVATPQPGSAPAAIRYGGQRTCPVMGDVLGEMGEPIPVSVKGQMVYVCCKGCVAKVRRDPDKYLAIANAERAGR